MNKSQYISLTEFQNKIEAKDGDFTNLLFEFVVVLDGTYDFDLDFSGSIFGKSFVAQDVVFEGDFSCSYAEFKHELNLSHSVIFGRAQFSDSKIHGSADFSNMTFNRMARFKRAYFYGDAFFDKTVFMKETLFVKTHFMRDVYFHKTCFGRRADFSYATFSDLHSSSFLSVRSGCEYQEADTTKSSDAPFLIFRYIFFSRRAMFSNVNLSRAVFSNSMIERIVFKDCEFSKKDDRSCFYVEVAQEVEIILEEEEFKKIQSGEQYMCFTQMDKEKQHLNIADRILFINKENPNETHRVFIVERHIAQNPEALFTKLSLIHPHIDYKQHTRALTNAYDKGRVEEGEEVVAYSFKRFDDRRHWENLEDINRQMKKSLEDSKDWQKAGEFYRNEMEAMIERMAQNGEKLVYRKSMELYGVITGFCESVVRILFFLVISFLISLLVLHQFRPELSFPLLLEYIFGFFIPTLGRDALSLRTLNLTPWQDIIIMTMIMWYYLLWFFLALTLRRKFRR